MDNRRVYKSYREKLSNNDNGFKPYSLITGKLKSLFQLKKSSPSNDENQSSASSIATTKVNESTGTTPLFIKPFKFPEPKLSETLPTNKNFKLPGSFTIVSPKVKKQPLHQFDVTMISSRSGRVQSTTELNEDASMNDDGDGDADVTANEALSNFFKRKGDKPLNDIEYEGVMALISKSRSGTPMRKRVMSESFFDQPQRKKTKNDTVGHDVGQEQKTLIHDASNISFNTSEYKPSYHTVHNDTFDRSHNQSYNNTTSMIPSIKRVYQFSGLPSPYSTRIRSPSSSRRPQRVRGDIDRSINATMTDTSINNTLANKTHEFKSETSKLLLSILDGKGGPEVPEAEEDESQKGAFKFVNPYSKNGRRVISRSKKTPAANATVAKPKTSISITANDIEETISYDKSEKLPEEPKDASIEKQLDKKLADKENGSTTPAKVAETTKTSTVVEDKAPPATSTQSTFSFKPISNGSLFSSKSSSESTKKIEEQTKPTFSFPTTNKSNKPEKESNTGIDKFATEFVFPDVDIKKVAIDSNKVDDFKSLFQF